MNALQQLKARIEELRDSYANYTDSRYFQGKVNAYTDVLNAIEEIEEEQALLRVERDLE